jgi:hypothetical protein
MIPTVNDLRNPNRIIPTKNKLIPPNVNTRNKTKIQRSGGVCNASKLRALLSIEEMTAAHIKATVATQMHVYAARYTTPGLAALIRSTRPAKENPAKGDTTPLNCVIASSCRSRGVFCIFILRKAELKLYAIKAVIYYALFAV